MTHKLWRYVIFKLASCIFSSSSFHFLKDYISPREGDLYQELNTGHMFSRAWRRLHVFPRLAQVTCFPALGTGYMFSRAWHRLHVFALSSDWCWFIALFGSVVIGQSQWYWISWYIVTWNFPTANKDVKIYIGIRKVHDRAQSFVLRSLTITQPKRLYWLVSRTQLKTYCLCARSRPKKRTKILKHLFHFFVTDPHRPINF